MASNPEDVIKNTAPLNTLGTPIDILGTKPEPIEIVTQSVPTPAATSLGLEVPENPGTEVQIHTSGPEPIDEPAAKLDADTLLKVAIDPAIAEKLAEEGFIIDQDEINRAIEEDQRRNELETALAPTASVASLNTTFVEADVDDVDLPPVTAEAFHELKLGINASFEEVANLLLEFQRQVDMIEARLADFNRRGGHRI